MKSFDTRVYSINDFIEWDRNNQLELNPKFQRRSVWSDNARSYLMDSIMRGKPIPKVFIRQKINPLTKTSVREVVDGQQRLRTILSYVKDGFKVNKKHNAQYGGLYFSQLAMIDDDIQTNILNYEISVDLLTNLPDAEILDIFSRLNSYAVTLNEQEKINADHFGPFKTLADQLGHKYHEFWIDSKILNESSVVRMGDVSLVADLLIAVTDGIKSKKQIKSYYDQYEQHFDHDPEVLAANFDTIMGLIGAIFGNNLRYSEFRRIHVFYSLFTSLYHLMFGIKGLHMPQKPITTDNLEKTINALLDIETLFGFDDRSNLSKDENQFLEDTRNATTDATVRIRRTRFIVSRVLAATE
jgi:hypothetical protein